MGGGSTTTDVGAAYRDDGSALGNRYGHYPELRLSPVEGCLTDVIHVHSSLESQGLQSEVQHEHTGDTTEGGGDAGSPPAQPERQVFISLLRHSDADAFILGLRNGALVDAWPADGNHTIVVHANDADSWGSIAQFLKIQRLSVRRRLRLVVDEPAANFLAPPRWTPSPGVVRFCGSVLYAARGVTMLALGGLVVWYISGTLPLVLLQPYLIADNLCLT